MLLTGCCVAITMCVEEPRVQEILLDGSQTQNPIEESRDQILTFVETALCGAVVIVVLTAAVSKVM